MNAKQLVSYSEVSIYDRPSDDPNKKLVSRYYEPSRRLFAEKDEEGDMMIQMEIAEIHPDGSETIRVSQPMHSYVGNFTRLMQAQFEQAAYSITDTGGTSRSVDKSTSNFRCNALTADDTLGIVVGTGAAAVVVGDTSLGNRITHGTGAAKTITGIVTSGGGSPQFNITSTAHGLALNNTVNIASVTGSASLQTALNGNSFTISSIVDANNFTINLAWDAGYTYTSGGTATVPIQLSYAAMQFDMWQTVGQTTSFVAKRRVTNNTASTITITEQGLNVCGNGTTWKFLVMRELTAAGGFALTAGTTAEVRFTITQTRATTSGGWTGNLVKMLYFMFSQDMPTGSTGIVNTSGSVVAFTLYQSAFGCTSAAAGTTYGIITGTGTTDASINDYVIGTIIANGSGAGNLYYNTQLFDAIVVSGSSARGGIKRTLDNQTANPITITEFVIQGMFRYSGSDYPMVIFRRKLSSTQTVPAYGSAQIKEVYGVTV